MYILEYISQMSIRTHIEDVWQNTYQRFCISELVQWLTLWFCHPQTARLNPVGDGQGYKLLRQISFKNQNGSKYLIEHILHVSSKRRITQMSIMSQMLDRVKQLTQKDLLMVALHDGKKMTQSIITHLLLHPFKSLQKFYKANNVKNQWAFGITTNA